MVPAVVVVLAEQGVGGEGVEHYDEFFRSLYPKDVDQVVEAMRESVQVSSML